MTLISKISVILCLLLHIQLGQVQQCPEDANDAYEQWNPNAHRPKKQKTWELELEEDLEPEEDQWQVNTCVADQSAVCPAENPHDVKYELPNDFRYFKNNRCKSPKTISKDEDDDEDADPAAMGDDDDADDDDEDDGDDENDEDNENDFNGEDEAFAARISCLLGALQKHTQAMNDNIQVLQSRLAKKKCPSNANLNTIIPEHPQSKWLKKPEGFGEREPFVQKTNTDFEDLLPPISSTKIAYGDHHRMQVSPLLQLIQRPTSLQSHLKSPKDKEKPEAHHWMQMRTRGSPAEFQDTIKSHPDEEPQVKYEEYEARMRRLMANRDVIERKVMQVMGPISLMDV
ncbi:uncharacterized protein LOC108098065 [Drosophila ficusphila]|uniref:uncharacterized protein LOC108098065 n=1 Tax=Drosophila ficusphila TaxID=30025 RepID=UPI0007E8039B|nr:uncharacterized protein LOC108098065 [Drosophila ficusphila]